MQLSRSITIVLAVVCVTFMKLPAHTHVRPAQAANPAPGSAPASLAGTYWNLRSMIAKGETEKESVEPDVEFCRNGSWGMLHYGGAREAGKYQLQGERLIMKSEDGSLFGDFHIKRQSNEMILDDGKYVLHLQYLHQAGC